ncbi:hypothetical protein OUZ56_013299 [Daphnia magna]|uniref:Uncharacterized protein n=1 Tax=Daphnia magna TaxID=35525 RepID=A0ABQ9Z5H3_9CRUS|nr:hypothetical protein OUZ56_013299 [Daphnia magna]
MTLTTASSCCWLLSLLIVDMTPEGSSTSEVLHNENYEHYLIKSPQYCTTKTQELPDQIAEVLNSQICISKILHQEAPEYNTNTYATPSYYTEASKY